MTGAQFLWSYSGGLLLALAWIGCVRLWLRRPPRPRPRPVADVDGLAYLRGSWSRVAETAIARLVHSGKVAVGEEGRLTATVHGDRALRDARQVESVASQGFAAYPDPAIRDTLVRSADRELWTGSKRKTRPDYRESPSGWGGGGGVL